MGQQQSAQPAEEQGAWWCRLLARAIAILGAFVCIICAIFTFLTFKALCFVAGALMLISSFIVLVFEAPICCQFVEFTQPIGRFAESRTYFQKGFLYAIMAIIPFALCVGLNTVFGNIGIFAAGVFYGLMALGKKADREQMMANAQGGQVPQEPPPAYSSEKMSANLVKNEVSDNPFQNP